MPELLTELVRNEVFRVYAFWSAILVMKMLFLSVYTGITRFRTKTFANPEDLPSKKLKVTFNNDDVERVRRAHRNDLENILPFLVIGFFYTLTSPAVYFATQLFRAAAIARIVHTFVYAIVVVPQPARALAFAVPLAVTGYMAFQTVLYFLWSFVIVELLKPEIINLYLVALSYLIKIPTTFLWMGRRSFYQ